MMKTYTLRIMKDKIKLTIAIILFLIPAVEVIQIAWQVHQGFSMPEPHYATFLSLYTIRHYLHKIMFWFLPVFLLLIFNEDSIEDQERGYKNLMVMRMGTKKYLRVKLMGSFFGSFLIICLGLILNMALVYLCFKNGTFSRDDFSNDLTYMKYDISRITVEHPVLANLIYILMTSFLAGLLSAVGTAIAITVHERKLVYGITFLLWFVPVMSRYSLMYVIQPFISVDYEDVIPALFGLIICYIVILAAAVAVEVKEDDL